MVAAIIFFFCICVTHVNSGESQNIFSCWKKSVKIGTLWGKGQENSGNFIAGYLWESWLALLHLSQNILIISCLGYVYICSLLVAGFIGSWVCLQYCLSFICHVLRFQFCVTIASSGFLGWVNCSCVLWLYLLNLWPVLSWRQHW